MISIPTLLHGIINHIFANWVEPSEMRVRTYQDIVLDEL